MSKYSVWFPYMFYTVKEVEAENEDEAIEKALNEVDGCISLCYHCMRENDISDNPILIEDEISAEEE